MTIDDGTGGGTPEPTLRRGPGRPRKNPQPPSELPGMTGKGVERVSIPVIDKLIARYIGARDNRMELTKKEVEAKTKLIEALREHKARLTVDGDGTIIYKHDELVCTLKHGKDELKVKTEVDEENGE